MANTFSIKVALKLLTDNYEKGINSATKATATFKGAMSSITKVFGGLAAGLGIAASATEIFKGVIATTQTAGDAWALTLSGVKGSLDGLYRTIGTGDWSNLFNNMVNSAKAARKLTAALDELFEKGNAKELNNSGIDVKIAQLTSDRKIAQAKKEYTEVERIGTEIKRLEAEKLANSMKVAQDTKRAFMDKMTSDTGLAESDLVDYLTSYNEGTKEALRERANSYNQDIERLKTLESASMSGGSTYGGAIVNYGGAIDELKNKIKGYTKEETIYAAITNKYNKSNDEATKHVIDSLVTINTLQTESINSQARNEQAIVRAGEKEDDFGRKAVDKREALIDKEKELQIERAKSNGLIRGQRTLDSDSIHLNKYGKASGAADFKESSPVQALETDKLLKHADALQLVGEKQQAIFDSGATGWDKINKAFYTVEAGASSFNNVVGLVGESFDNLGSIFSEQTDAYKAFAMAQAGIATYLAASQALSDPTVPTFLKPFLMGTIIAAGLSNVAKIAGFESGGIIGGNSFSGDKIVARVNSGEMVLNKGQQANLFSMVNSGGSNSSTGGVVEFKISGNNLVGVLDNHSKRIKNFK